MSDTLTNALRDSAHSSSVLAGIANPAQLNPLAGIGTAQQLVGTMQGLDKNQAVKAWGEVLQQATDQDGNVNYPLAQSLAAKRPDAAYGMQEALRTTSALRGEQLNNAAGHLKMVGTSAMTVANDPSDGNVNASFDNLKSSGMPAAQIEQERARWLAMSPAERQANAHRVGLTALDQLHQVVGQTTGQNIGGQIVPLTITQPSVRGPGAVVQGPGAVTTTASPDTALTMPGITYPATQADVDAGRATSPGETIHLSGAERARLFGLGGLLPPGAQEVPYTGATAPPPNRPPAVVRGSDGKPVGPANPPRLLNVPGSTTAPPATPPAAPVITPAPATPAPPAPAAAAPPAPPAATGKPAFVPTVPTSDLGGGGVQVASNALMAPELGPASQPSPLVPGDVAAMARGMGRAGSSRAPGTQVAGTTFTTGAGYDEQGEAKLSQDRLTASRNAAANYATEAFPGMEALHLYGRGITTAPGADWLNNVKGFAAGVYRSMGGDPGRVGKEVAEKDALSKWLANESMNNPIAAKSDAMLGQVLAGNANTHIHELAGEDMIKAGMAMRRMKVAASSEWDNNPDVRKQYGYFTRYERELAKTIDPRAFAWDLYNDAQKKTLTEDLAAHRSDPAYAQRLLDSVALARRNGLITSQPAMP